jgi:hypothetical protein
MNEDENKIEKVNPNDIELQKKNNE